MDHSRSSATGWIAGLLQLSDTFYPTGSYAHSFGVEGLAQEGTIADLSALRAFLLEEALPALARTDLAICAQAWEAAGARPDWDRLKALAYLGSAVRGAREPRAAAEAIGRQRCELAERLRGPDSLPAEFARRAADGAWPQPASVIAALEARMIGAPAEAALSILLYSSVAALLAASVKLLRLGQNAVQGLLTEALQRAPDLFARARALSPEEIGSFNPWWDLAAARHEFADFRLFIS